MAGRTLFDERLQVVEFDLPRNRRARSTAHPARVRGGRPVRRDRASDPSYRAHLDGLRAIAVYLVVAYHADLAWFGGGFVGVDVFFVLSGYLVTGILLRDLQLNGRIRLVRFYARRVRRLLPAAAATLVVTGLVYGAIASPLELLDHAGGFDAAFLYRANWEFVSQSSDYFAADTAASPVLHFWSLAVEEQFYFLWPLLLGALALGARRAGASGLRFVRGAIASGAVVSLAWALSLAFTRLDRAYYGTDTRAYQLLAGAFLAVTPLRVATQHQERIVTMLRRAALFALGALALLSTSLRDLNPIVRGMFVTAVAVLLIAALEHGGDGAARAALARPTAARLGRISYGIYLWHWPVIVLANHIGAPNPLQRFLLATLVATALAALCHQLFELPIRESLLADRHGRAVVAGGLALSMIGGLVVMPSILDGRTDASAVLAAAGRGTPSEFRLLDWRVARDDVAEAIECEGAPLAQCVAVRGTGATWMLMGDSNARMYIRLFERLARENDATLVIAAFQGCPWQVGLNFTARAVDVPRCEAVRADWHKRLIPAFEPDVIFLAGRGLDDPAQPSTLYRDATHDITVDDPEFAPLVRTTTQRTLVSLAAHGRQVVVIEPMPSAPLGLEPLDCLATGGDCTFKAATERTALEGLYRAAATAAPKADGTDVVTLDLDRLVCRRWPSCDPVVGDVIVRRDGAHLTATFAESLWQQVDDALRRLRIAGAV